MSIEFIERFFHDVPSCVDVNKIKEQWMSLANSYNVSDWILPLPIWAKRQFDYSGESAWEIIKSDIDQLETDKPFCIYLHVPFCSSKCGFCDSYSFKLDRYKDEHIRNYVDRLRHELLLWAELGTMHKRPVSTMHFGGGTPAFLGEASLAELVYCIKSNFNINSDTELALETTVESLSPSMLQVLNDLGFRRLHVGVQSLENNVRKVIGRRRDSEEVIERIEKALDFGWVVSVDLISGLPGQSLKGFINGIQDLIHAGVNGFSIYELLIFAQNRKWAESYQLGQRDHLPNYLMFQAGISLLTQRGFSINHFNHWSDCRDQNIYFTAPSRNEDCLAVGAIADGILGDFHYRHPHYAPYIRSCKDGYPGLIGGLRRTQVENALQPFIAALHSGRIDMEICPFFEEISKKFGINIIEKWRDHGLIVEDGMGGFLLTTNGSWFTGNMVNEFTALPLPRQV